MKTSPLLLALAIPLILIACRGDDVQSRQRCEAAVAKIMVDWNTAWQSRPLREDRANAHERLFDSFNQATNESAVQRCMAIGLTDREAACIADAPAGFVAGARCLRDPRWNR